LRKLVCERLASVFCTKMTSLRIGGERNKGLLEIDAAAEIDSPSIKMSNYVSGKPEMTSSSSSSSSASMSTAQSISSVEGLLASIHDLLLRRLHIEARLRHQMDVDQQMTSEWMIAAAVIDRICFIMLAVLLTAGSATFLFLLFLQPDFRSESWKFSVCIDIMTCGMTEEQCKPIFVNICYTSTF